MLRTFSQPGGCIFLFLFLLLTATESRADNPDLSEGYTPGIDPPSSYMSEGLRTDTIPGPAHPDSIPYDVDPGFGRQLLKAPAFVLHTAVMPLKYGVIWMKEKEVVSRLSDFFLNDEGTAGFYPSFSFGGRTPFAAGVTYFNRDLFNRGHSLDLTTFYTNTTNFKVGTTYKIPPARGQPYQFTLNGNVRLNDDQDIYLGGNSGADDLEVDYAIERYDLQADVGYLLRDNILASLHNGIRHTVIDDVSAFTDNGEPVGELINPSSFGIGTVTLYNAGVSTVLDFRSAGFRNTNSNVVSAVTSSYDFKQTKIRVHSGTLVDAGFSYNRSLNKSGYEFIRYYGDLQQFIPLPGLPPNRRLALRTRLEKNYPLGSADVPFYEQSLLGDADNLRGYEQDRFRNLGSLLVTLEYRYPIWDTWDAVVFTDQGQVFREFSQLGIERFHGSVGTGLRFMTSSDFLFRVEVAFSKAGTRSLLEFSTNF